MKTFFFSILFAILIIIGTIVFSGPTKQAEQKTAVNNVSILDGKQFIDLTAKGGYTPRKSLAKAGLQTTLRVNTSGTFDCSSSIRIPSMDISRILPQTGVTDIDLGTPQLGTLSGTCGMGMYPFEISFQ